MWEWLLVSYVIFTAILLSAAVFVALFSKDSDRRASGYRVLKLIWITATGPSGLVAIVIKSSELGWF